MSAMAMDVESDGISRLQSRVFFAGSSSIQRDEAVAIRQQGRV